MILSYMTQKSIRSLHFLITKKKKLLILQSLQLYITEGHMLSTNNQSDRKDANYC